MHSIHDAAALEQLRRQGRIEPNDLRRLRNVFYKKQQTPDEALGHLSDGQRTVFDSVRFRSLELHDRHDSRLDGASKLVFTTKEGLRLEAVIMRIEFGYSYPQIADAMGRTTPNAARMLVARALVQLGEDMDAHRG